MQWTVRSDRSLYSDQWLDLRLADVELPDGRHLDHRLIRMAPSAGALVVDDRDRVLLIWRHRFITGRWGWEIPMGGVADGEAPVDAAAREVEEETGWRPHQLRLLATWIWSGRYAPLKRCNRSRSTTPRFMTATASLPTAFLRK